MIGIKAEEDGGEVEKGFDKDEVERFYLQFYVKSHLWPVDPVFFKI